jgi:hypothetical protein
MLHPITGFDERQLARLTSIAGQGYRVDWHLFLSLPAVLMIVSTVACVWRSQGGVLATLVALNGICALAAVLGLLRVARTLKRLKLGRDDAEPAFEWHA